MFSVARPVISVVVVVVVVIHMPHHPHDIAKWKSPQIKT
jgi:hypothetical protein